MVVQLISLTVIANSCKIRVQIACGRMMSTFSEAIVDGTRILLVMSRAVLNEQLTPKFF